MLLQLVGDADLAVRRLLQRKRQHRLLVMRVGANLEVRLLAGNLRQRRFPAGLVQLLEPARPLMRSPQAAMSPVNFSRRTVLRNTMRPAASTPCTVNTDFARSTPTVVISFMTSPPGSD